MCRGPVGEVVMCVGVQVGAGCNIRGPVGEVVMCVGDQWVRL